MLWGLFFGVETASLTSNATVYFSMGQLRLMGHLRQKMIVPFVPFVLFVSSVAVNSKLLSSQYFLTALRVSLHSAHTVLSSHRQICRIGLSHSFHCAMMSGYFQIGNNHLFIKFSFFENILQMLANCRNPHPEQFRHVFLGQPYRYDYYKCFFLISL